MYSLDPKCIKEGTMDPTERLVDMAETIKGGGLERRRFDKNNVGVHYSRGRRRREEENPLNKTRTDHGSGDDKAVKSDLTVPR